MGDVPGETHTCKNEGWTWGKGAWSGTLSTRATLCFRKPWKRNMFFKILEEEQEVNILQEFFDGFLLN